MTGAAAATGPVAVLAHPGAGRGRHRAEIPVVLDRLRAAGFAIELLSASSIDDAIAACRAAVTGGAAALVAMGGDGTVNLALQAVAGTPTPFGAIPGGTGNDFVREIGLPTEVIPAVDRIVDALRTGTRRRVDLARAVAGDGSARWFGAVLGAGFDAIVNERANRMRFPRGPRKYDVAIFAELLRLRPRAYTMRLDGVEHHFEAVLVAVGNTPAYGGGMRICPGADATDGLLDVVVVGPVGRLTFTRIKPRVYAGTHIEDPRVRSYRAATVEIAGDDSMPATRASAIVPYVDGERTAPLPVTVTAMPGALTLLG